MDCNAPEERLLGDKQRRGRRPNTLNRTGRRGRLIALAADSQTLAGSSSDFSTRHTRVLQESGGEPVTILNRLINTLQESGIPGPQLFRLQKEFSEPLGEGGQGNVRGLNADAAKRYEGVHKSIRKNWPADGIAIKQHLERKSDRTHKNRFDKNSLSWRFRAAECEVLALAPGLFQNHPNIVRLVGWGLCLDTAENPTSPCCGGLQLPLLVFERAEMNLAQLLENLSTASRDERSDEVRMEDGLESFHRTRRPLSLSRRTWRSFRSWIPAEQDTYALVRMLCIDVGQGLKSIHENKFTHGDLKPDNILIFRAGDGWRAKLCDFGCAMGHDSDLFSTSDGIGNNIDADPKQTRKRRGATYLGTDGWRPSDRELKAIRGFDELRRCDLYVYGLLVWSSFCHRGKHHYSNPRLQDILEDVEKITIHTENQLEPPVCKQWIASQVTRVLKDTMKEPKQRSLEPWMFFGRRTWWEWKQTGDVVQNPKQAADVQVEESRETRFQLSLEVKEKYNRLGWWLGDDQPPRQASRRSGNYDHDDSSQDNAQPGPASYIALDADDNCLSIEVFHTERRMDDSKNLCFRISLAVQNLKMNGENQSYRQELYYLARFRSRVPLEWWRCHAVEGGNILQEVLQSVPSVDIHTLAWLCAGPIGRGEVTSLDTQEHTWASMMVSGVLDESERLDRFLLLLQFGAPIATPWTRDSRFHETFKPERDLTTIFVHFIESCRSAILVTVLNQMFRRLKTARDEGFISYATMDYFDRMRDGRLLHRTLVLLDPSLAGVTSQEMIQGVLRGMGEVTELSALIPPDLPHGWTAVESQGDPHNCYTDRFTYSVTLTKPRVSLLQMRQLTVGFLQDHADGMSYHVDLLACIRAVFGSEKDSELAQDIEQRFPYYGEAWYIAEWNLEPIVVDVFKMFKDRGRIRTFTSRLRATKVNMRIGEGYKTLGFMFLQRILILTVFSFVLSVLSKYGT